MAKETLYTAKRPDALGKISYSQSENAVWADLYSQQMPMVRKHAAQVFLDGLGRLDIPHDRVPQCSEVSKTLMELTGWRVSPVPALIGFETFFNMLAEKIFPAASFIRSRADFDYIEEPDIFHEIFGHTPLLTDARFAEFSQAIGRAGQQCEKQDYSWLIRLYWFTIEFGVTREKGVLKALGSGLASSPSEMEWSMSSDSPEFRPFDVLDILRTPYRIDIAQPVYFVIDDYDQLFSAAKRNLIADIAQARKMGLHAPKYPEKKVS
ncbi:phenylalanine 4-monooxygenase [Cochlodiniinecator piscidefendens]|uniref:phenylalanine 4-monooxygenase n=1 Tax=Cochlodiniinecator piscidefendens TaxID=2715756 RepID=UPI00140E0341|nr:phenylalanine 4-monooxygenase [Cochlodiniinecator piscidefendens]